MIRRNYRLLCNFLSDQSQHCFYIWVSNSRRDERQATPQNADAMCFRGQSANRVKCSSRVRASASRVYIECLRFTAATNGRCYRHFVFLATVPLCEWISSEPKVIAYASLSTKLLSWCIRYRTRLLLLQLRQSVVTWDVAGGRARAKSTE